VGWVGPLAARGHADRQHIGQRLPGQAGAELEAGQVGGENPDHRVGARAAGDGQQVLGDGALGQVEHRHLAPGGQPGASDHRQHRGPAGEGAPGHVHPVDLAGQGHGVPLQLATESALAGPPVAPHPGVLLMPADQLAVLRGTGPGHPLFLLLDPAAQFPLAAPDATTADNGPRQCRGQPDDGERDIQDTDHRQRQDEGGECRAAADGQLQRAAQPVLLPALCGYPALIELLLLRRDRTARPRARSGVHERVLPAQVDPVGPERPSGHRGPP
jgi:hypothetical protein